MSELRRIRGRPKRSDGGGCRDAIVEATRVILRRCSSSIAQRNEIAVQAGVAPALISYYFPNHDDLLDEAIWPVLSIYMKQLEGLFQDPQDPKSTLRSLIHLLVDFNVKEASLFDFALRHAGRRSGKATMAAEMMKYYGLIARYFNSCAAQRQWRIPQVGFFVFALWGICKFVAQTPALPISMFGAQLSREELIEFQAGLIFDLIWGGVVPALPKGQSDPAHADGAEVFELLARPALQNGRAPVFASPA